MSADRCQTYAARVVVAEAVVPLEVLDGVTRHVTHGEQMTVMRIAMTAGSAVPAHVHVHEQYTHVLSGQLELALCPGTDVEEVIQLSVGDSILIPSMVPHEARAAVPTQVVEMFSPRRDEVPGDLP